MRHTIRFRTISASLRHSVVCVRGLVREALVSCGPGARLSAWMDRNDAPSFEVRLPSGHVFSFDVPEEHYAGLRLYFRQWFRGED